MPGWDNVPPRLELVQQDNVSAVSACVSEGQSSSHSPMTASALGQGPGSTDCASSQE